MSRPNCNLNEKEIEDLFNDVEILEREYESFSTDLENTNIIWQAQEGSQTIFLTCPVYECLLTGPRGTGKTDVLLMDFARDCGVGWGQWWFGIIFRQTYKQLADVVAKSRRWFPRIFPGIEFNKSNLTWTWPTGEVLMFSYIDSPSDYETYHGWEIPSINFEEITNWSTDECYEAMKTCCRSSCPITINGKTIPKRIRSTTNPWGKGHSWVKKYFINAGEEAEIVRNKEGKERTWINSHILENKKLIDVDPDYIKTLKSIRDPNKRKAWFEGSWDIVSGGIIGDLWDRDVHVLEPFEIPKEWRIDRAMDWGQTSPFAIGWFAESDGSEIKMPDGKMKYFPKGSIIMIHEWYGWNGEENQGLNLFSADVAKKILKIEKEHPLLRDHEVLPGPADNQIFDSRDGQTIASKMARVRFGKSIVKGVVWRRSNKNPGSRIIGLELFRGMLSEALKEYPEEPCFYVFNTCREGFLRTVPDIQRDEHNPDDALKQGEDHVYDMVRYRVLSRRVHSMTNEV